MALRDGVELPRQAGVRRRLDGDGVLDGPGGSAEAAEGKSVIDRCHVCSPVAASAGVTQAMWNVLRRNAGDPGSAPKDHR
jgi:hypothetical protein